MKLEILDAKQPIKQLVVVDTHQSILTALNAELSKEEFNFVVTAENLPFAKTQMAALNKSKEFFKSFRKQKVADESQDIETFKANFKEYDTIIDNKRESIKRSTDAFEQEQKDSITKELSLYAEESIKAQNIREEFKEVNTADLILLGSVTPKGALTKKVKDTIDSRVLLCKSKQDKYDMRLMKLENLSYQNGLESPLTITHVQGIIYLDSDEEYNEKLNELISSEMDRQNTIKQNLQQQADKEAKENAKREMQQAQNKIRNIFMKDYGSMNLTIGQVNDFINQFTNYDHSQFGDNEDFARNIANGQIDFLKKVRYAIEQKNHIKESYPGVEVQHEIIKEVEPKQDIPSVEHGMKVVLVDVHLQFKVKDTIPNDKIIKKVNDMLSVAGVKDSLIDVEVVS